MKRLLLVSSSRTHGTGFLDHCSDAISHHFRDISRILFVPYALADLDGYAHLARTRLSELGFHVDSIHDTDAPREAVLQSEAIFIGGGNSFRLLSRLYELELIDAIRSRAEEGMPYLGCSAGTNMACPTIRTTNDMPIVEPPSLAALGLVPFQINPHFLDADPDSPHQGETRETRLREYLEENETPVLGIREGSWLLVHGEQGLLLGSTGGLIFARDKPTVEIAPETSFQLDAIGDVE